MEIIEKSERRRRRTVTLILVVLLLAVLAGAGALWVFFRNDLGASPAAKSYGTALYDSTSESYLDKALDRRVGVVAYLGWPGFDGALVYSADTPTPETPESGAEPGSIVRFATPSALDAATPGNTVLECTGDDYKALARPGHTETERRLHAVHGRPHLPLQGAGGLLLRPRRAGRRRV